VSETFESAKPDLKKTRRAKPQFDLSKLDKLPPHSIEGEQAVLACLMLSPEDCLNECEERGVKATWFYVTVNQTVFTALQEMSKAGIAIDLITVSDWLKSRQQLDLVGGSAYLSSLLDAVPSAANLDYYVDIIEEKFQLRRMASLGTNVVREVYEVDEDGEPTKVAELLDRVTREFLVLSESAAGVQEQTYKQVVPVVIEEMEKYHRGRAQMTGLPTGLEYLDKITAGLGGDNGNYIVLSARPGTGKTSLALDVVNHVAIDYVDFRQVVAAEAEQLKAQGKEITTGEDGSFYHRQKGLPVGIFSLEMASKALVKRMLFQRAGADMQRWRTGFANQQDIERLLKANAELCKAPIYIDDTARCTIDSLKAKARRWYRQYGIRLFVIDYIQLMRLASKRRRMERREELEEISAELAALGKELNVPIIVIAQMNRDFEKDPNRAPRLSDLKDCGSIEQDADLIIFLYKPKLKDAEEEEYEAAMEKVFGKDWSLRPYIVKGLVAKYRFGPSDKFINFLFHGSSTHFEDYTEFLKKHGLKAVAAGEKKKTPAGGSLPSNKDLGYEDED
jgi:replicative DNA helicase